MRGRNHRRGFPALALLLLAAIPATTRAQPSPTITLYQPTGMQQGSVTVSYHIEYANLSSVDLTVEYSEDYGASWHTATTTGLTSGITMAEYDSAFVWVSDGDLYPFSCSQVWLRVTPSDGTAGTADITKFPLDNQEPAEVCADGIEGESIIHFHFDEPVDIPTASDVGNFNLSGGLTPASIAAVEEAWSVDPLPAAVRAPGGAVIDGEAWMVGGFDGSDYLTSLYRYNNTIGDWEQKADMPTPREAMAVGEIDGKLYVAGGETGGPAYHNVLEIYDPDTDSWTSGASMNTARSWASYGVIEGRLYVTGGLGTTGTLTSGEVYDPATDTWSPIADHPQAKQKAAFGVIDRKLYVAGGADPPGTAYLSLHVYDPETDTWTALADMASHRQSAASGVVQDRLYIAGGLDSADQPRTEIFYYLPAGDTWGTASITLDATRNGADGLSLDERLYVAGGYRDGTLTTEVTEFNPSSYFEMTLETGQTLPGTSINLQAIGITDRFGNVSSFLATDFTPTTVTPPSVIVRQPEGTRSGDVPIHFIISDPEGDAVDLLVEYSTDGLVWQVATVADPGGLCCIDALYYDNWTVWASGDDLSGQEWETVWVRITPSDDTGSGTPDQTTFHLDNQPPQLLYGHGEPGDRTKIRFWYDEPVDINSVRQAVRYSIPEGLTVQSVGRRDSWRSVDETAAPTARVAATTAVIGRKVYVAGGQDAVSNRLDLLEIYDTDTQTWSTGASLPEVRAGAAGGVIDGKWYLAGGAGPSGSLNTIIVYDPDTDTWSGGLATLAVARGGCRGAVVDGLFYVLGGDNATQSAVEVYDPKRDTWTARTGYSVPRHSAVIGVIGSFIYLAGGYDNSSLRTELEVYDPQNDIWTTLAPMPEGRTAAAGGAVYGRLVVAGGTVFTGYSTEVRLYNPANDTWFAVLDMPESRSGANSIVQDEKIYVAGGYDPGSTLVTSILEYDVQAWNTVQLAPGESLPDNSVTLQATDIPDLYGNSQSMLSTDILPYELSAHISGTAYDENPNPIEGMRVMLRPTGQAWIDTTYTDANGEYWFDVAPGTYEVHGQKINGLNYYETAWLDSFHVDLGQTVVHDLDITRGPTFGVALVDINGLGGDTAEVNTGDAVAVTMDYVAWNDAVTPLSNEWLVLGLGSAGYSGYSLGMTPVYPGASGTASFNFTAPTTGGTYTLYIKRASGTSTEAGAIVRYSSRFWNVAWEYIPVGTLTVHADATIAGAVYEPDTTIPIPGAKVRLRPNGTTAWSDSTVTGSDGTYSFAVSAGAVYNIFVEALQGGRYFSCKPEDGVLALGGGQTTVYNPPMGVGYGFALENLDLAGTGRDSINVQPGGSVIGTLTLRTWDSWATGGNVSLLIGVGGGAQDLDYRVVTTPGNYTGTSGDITLDLQAPGTSGTYSIYVVLDRDGIPTADDYVDRFPFDAAYAFLPVGRVVVDGTAPGPATDVDMGGSGTVNSDWMNTSTIRVRWTDPSDVSGITGVVYKLVRAGWNPVTGDRPPQDATDLTGTSAVTFDGGSGKTYFDLDFTGQVSDGANHLYIWLVDGAYNSDFNQWAEGWINFDATGPDEPSLLTPDSGATVDVQRPTFTWSASADYIQGSASWYVLRVSTNASMGEIVYQPALPLSSSELSHTPTADLPNGNYYWSVYAEDAVGNLSTWTARPLTVSAATMDAPVLVSVTGGDWSNQEVTTLSWNAVSGASQYFLQLTIGTDTGFAATFYENTVSSTSMGVGVGGRGDGEYRWRVRAEAGLDFSPWSEDTFRLDRTAPSLSVDALPTSISTGQAVMVTAHASDANGLQFVRLFHRESGSSGGFTQVNMSATGGDAYQGQIPGSVVGMNGFQYYLLSRDPAGNESRADASGGLSGDETGGAEIGLPNMPASGNLPRDRWQMVSVPHVPDNAGISALLPNLPAYDEKVWRFFRWTGSAYQEVSSASLQPGRGYWLYHRRDSVQLDPGSGHTIPSGRPFEITLTPGWNDIGSPWLFNVAWSDILNESGYTDTQVSRPYGYDGTDWVLPPSIGELPVWYGVSVYNRGSSNLTLKVPPLAAGQLVAEAKTLTEAMADQGLTAQLPIGRVEEDGVTGWRLHILLGQEGARAGDVQNYVGVLTGHTAEWDPDDLPDPPMPIEGSARVMVDRTGRAQDRGWYATDYQGPGEPGWEWPLRVESVQGGRRVTLTFRGLTGLPEGAEAALVDVRSNLRIDLIDGSNYRFFPGVTAGQPPREGTAVDHALRLVVGSASFVDARTAGTIRLPAEASLDQNYPNPFNPTTTIRFALAEPSRVRLTVLNVRGQQVAVLADGLYNAGPHTLQWDGRDATGRAAASGIYFYRLEAAGKVISKKMTLIR